MPNWTFGSLGEQSFVVSVSDSFPGQVIVVPGASSIVDLAPENVEWTLNLPLSFGWETHGILLEKIKSAGEEAGVAALKRRSTAGGALAVCTLAVTVYAESVASLGEADTSQILLEGLNVSATGSRCRAEAASVEVFDEAGRPLTLVDDLQRLQRQAEVLEFADGKLGYAQRAWKVLRLGLRFKR